MILDPQEIEEAKPESASTIEIGDFVKFTEIDPKAARKARRRKARAA